MSRIPRFGRSTGTGVVLALGTAVISGVSVFVNGYAVKQLPDPALYTTLKNGVAAMLLVWAALAVGGLPRGIGGRRWMGIVALGAIGGSVPFLLFFNGLAAASAPSAAIIHKTLFIWVALLAVVLLRERLGVLQLGALAVLVVSQLLILPPSGVTLGGGEALIAAATAFWAVETIVARRLLPNVPVLAAGAGRLGFGLVILVGYLAISGKLAAVGSLSAGQWAWVVGTGVLLAGYVATWYAALQRAPAATVAAVLTLGAPITAAMQAVAGGAVPPALPVVGYVLTLAGGGAAAVLAVRRRRAPVIAG